MGEGGDQRGPERERERDGDDAGQVEIVPFGRNLLPEKIDEAFVITVTTGETLVTPHVFTHTAHGTLDHTFPVPPLQLLPNLSLPSAQQTTG